MDKIKNKYEIILGFVTLVISLSAFKEELAKVVLELGYTTITLADYFLWIVYGLSICLYFYIVEKIVSDTRIGNWKVFDLILRTAYFLFVFVLLTPILIFINILFFKLYVILTNQFTESNPTIQTVLHLVTGAIGAILSQLISSKLIREKKRKAKEEIEEQEIKELDNATKLFIDGYYSHSLLESFKVLETHLFKMLTEKNIRVQRYNQKDLIQFSLKEGIISEADMPSIHDIRGMRNIAAHSDSDHTKQQASFALNFVRELLKRN
jgi:hypothetical protein